jgi:xylulokinase
MDEPVLLGIDIGTTSTKALLLGPEGGEVASAVTPTPFDERREMRVPALLDAVAEVIRRLGPAARRVQGVGISGMGESGAAFGKDLEPLSPVIAWHDPRGTEEAALLSAIFDDGLVGRTGRPTTAVSSIAKLGWLTRHALPPVHAWLGVPELCAFYLCGGLATDPSLACRTGCFDIVKRSYIDEVTEAFGLNAGLFPDVVPAGSPAGTVHAAGSTWASVPQGVPVTIAGHDHLTAASTVSLDAGDLVNSVGTAETVLRRAEELPDLMRCHASRIAVSISPDDSGWIGFTSATRTGMVRARAAGVLNSDAIELDALAESAPPLEAAGFLASLGSSRPQVPRGPIAGLWAGVLHELAGRTLEAAGRMNELFGAPRRLVVLGGGANSPAWLRAKDERFDVPVVRAVTSQAVARGAAIFAGISAGWWRDVAGAPLPQMSPVTEEGTRSPSG